MTIDQALKIVSDYEFYEDITCSCHIGNLPCGKCEMCPPKEVYEETLLVSGNGAR